MAASRRLVQKDKQHEHVSPKKGFTFINVRRGETERPTHNTILERLYIVQWRGVEGLGRQLCLRASVVAELLAAALVCPGAVNCQCLFLGHGRRELAVLREVRVERLCGISSGGAHGPFNGEMSNAIDSRQDSTGHQDSSCRFPSLVFAHAGEIPCTVKNNRSPRETTHRVAFQAGKGIAPCQSGPFIDRSSYDHKHLAVCNWLVVQHGDMVWTFQSADSARGSSSDFAADQPPR